MLTQGLARIPVNFNEVSAGDEVNASNEWDRMMGYFGGAEHFEQPDHSQDYSAHDQLIDLGSSDSHDCYPTAPDQAVTTFYAAGSAASQPPQIPQAADVAPTKLEKCLMCGGLFPTRNQMFTHIDIVHPKDESGERTNRTLPDTRKSKQGKA
ncbi:unnamed protein product [Zymoseptoria tritici ST99CH_1A5]|uniref:C2H2-type domain-containing protein n=1 Tax=Zymoseptoria tritici ST99CH_1A5 TaxID=1276529 RepID=A0A1Y6LP38_ZYMTR|nr:unnamed protein product [Zymoseptoria tritici ST99CH_1A5]